MTELVKFTSEDAWNDLASDVTDEEVVKASNNVRFVQRYEGPLTVKSARHIFDKKAANDSKFHSFVVTFETPNGEVFDYNNYFSFSTAKYGPKGTMFFGIRLKSLFRALGFDDLHISTATPEKRAAAIASQKKYLGRWDSEGYLPRWAGLKLQARIGYQTGSYHMAKNGELFVVVDADDKPVVFPEVKSSWNDETNGWDIEKGVVIQNPSKDEIKRIVANNGLKLSYSDLLSTQGILGANSEILPRFEGNGDVKPAGALDAHSAVKADSNDEPF